MKHHVNFNICGSYNAIAMLSKTLMMYCIKNGSSNNSDFEAF